MDATNYESLADALSDVKGEICIITEGLIPYFNESELVSMCKAVHRLLSQLGGCWITADRSVVGIYSDTFRALYGDNNSDMLALTKSSASEIAGVKLCQNSMCKNGYAAAEAFLNEQGFKVERHSISDYLPDLNGVDTDKLREAYRPMEAWIMTADTASLSISDSKDKKPFSASMQVDGEKMTAVLSGRLDTITAPELLEKFETAKQGVTSCIVNAKDLDYISSAGLRVLLIMYKALNGNMKIEQTNPVVREILEVTSLEQFIM